MKVSNVYQISFLVLLFPTVATSFSFKSIFRSIKCRFKICCDDKWVISNLSGLKQDLDTKLHGQHLVRKTVYGQIESHLRTADPPKALSMSFHGPTGVGKNFVARIIAENLYKDGLDSKFVHLISSTKEFLHGDRVPLYKDTLKSWIEGNVTECDRSMFIFDEIDKMPPLLLDVLKPYLDNHHKLAGISYRRAIFIFLSNTGSSVISQHAYTHWQSGKKREDLELRDIENDVMKAAINNENQSGLWYSQLIGHHMITAFIPFLPLERQHIRLCIKDVLVAKRYFVRNRGIPEEIENRVLNEMTFSPEEEKIFSTAGCRRVFDKVGYVMNNLHDRSEL